MNLAEHADHPWVQRGRCVYCETCRVRLFQGKVPKTDGARRAFALMMDRVLDDAFDDAREIEVDDEYCLDEVSDAPA